jgi:sulfane dehydrogenase subunit SoxC
MTSKQTRRRQFLKNAPALAGVALGTLQSAGASAFGAAPPDVRPEDLHAYGERSHFVDSKRVGNIGLWPIDPSKPRDYGFRTPLQDSAGMVTPASLHFILSHGFDPPDIDPRQHRLLIHGMVDRPLIFTVDELKRLPSVSRFHFLECHGNSSVSGPTGPPRKVATATVQDTHGLTSCSEWTGVPLSLLLKEVSVQKGATWFVAEGADTVKHAKSIPIGKGMDDVLVVFAQNGEPVRPEQGFPLRLLVPGWQGINNVKWLRRIYLTDQPYMGNMESTKYPSARPDGKSRWFESELGPKSVITRPSGGQQLPMRGFYEITGLAWSGGGTVRKVEVSANGGQTWQLAELQSAAHPKAHTRFRLAWNWNGEECVLQSRCTDDRGEVQPTLAELGKIWGVDMDYFRSMSPATADMGNFNAIQPWKVTADGSVRNALV